MTTEKIESMYDEDSRPVAQCRECRVFHSNGDAHVCVRYDGPPCSFPGCDEPTVWVMIGAPGVGSGRECRAGHYDGTCRELTLSEVI